MQVAGKASGRGTSEELRQKGIQEYKLSESTKFHSRALRKEVM